MSNCIFYEPFYFEFERLLNDPSLLEQQGKATRSGTIRSFRPRLDLHEDKEKNIVTATFELPGVSKDDVQLNFQNGKLTVSAETKKSSEQHAESGYTLREHLHGKFSRTIQLPQGVQDEQIKATMENGLLTVTFPSTLPELAPKKIVVSHP
ncbi:small heat shock protein [Phlegmacium glaucopus]|nr:small heat shock protein [Phlegmacium glaucopus]